MPAGPAFETPSGELFRECLDYHFARVEELPPAFARFVARAFHDEMRAALCVAAGELVKTVNREDRIAERAYTHDRIRYVVCGAPGGMDAAAKSSNRPTAASPASSPSRSNANPSAPIAVRFSPC